MAGMGKIDIMVTTKIRQLVAYVFGPYRADSEEQRLVNIDNAQRTSMELWKNGIVTICPHSNTTWVSNKDSFGDCLDEDYIVTGDLVLVSKCDLLVRACGDITICDKSDGVRRELVFAETLGIPVFNTVDGALKFKKRMEHVEVIDYDMPTLHKK